jgi:hypothetical protein
MSGSAKSRNHRREAYRRAVNLVYEFLARSSAARARRRVFSLDNLIGPWGATPADENGRQGSVE